MDKPIEPKEKVFQHKLVIEFDNDGKSKVVYPAGVPVNLVMQVLWDHAGQCLAAYASEVAVHKLTHVQMSRIVKPNLILNKSLEDLKKGN